MNLTAEQVIDAAPAGSIVTLQLDANRNLLAWYIRPPDPVIRVAFGGSGPSHQRGTW